MAQGDAYFKAPTDVADGAYLDLRPASSQVVIHNVAVGGSAELYAFDGGAEVLIDSQTGAGGWMNTQLHASAANGWRVKNISGGSIKIACDGIYTT